MDQIRITMAAARVNAGLTQSEMAQKLKVGKQTVNNWERGITEPKISQAKQFSEICGIPYDCIIFMPTKTN